MAYVDGFVLVVPKKNALAYKKMARMGAKMWKKYGALEYKECVIDDATPPWITLTFPKMTKAKKNEQVWFSYIVYKSKKHRDQVNAKVMTHMDEDTKMPFDMKKISYAGFKVVVDA